MKTSYMIDLHLSLDFPYHPWDWYIYLLIYNRNQLNVGTVNIPDIDAMGLAAVFAFFLRLVVTLRVLWCLSSGIFLVSVTLCARNFGGLLII